MAGETTVNDLFPAIHARWLATPLAALLPRVYGYFPEPGAPMPYVFFKPNAETRFTRSNRGRYVDLQFDAVLYHADPEEGTRLMGLVIHHLTDTPLTLTGTPNRLLDVEADDNWRWSEEDHYWSITAELTGLFAKPGPSVR